MKKPDFLVKLVKEGKIRHVHPNEELKQAYIQKSESYMESAKILLENDKLEESVSMTYYSMYYMLTALLQRTGIKCENHAAAILLLKKMYGLDNRPMSLAKKERIDKQYYVDFSTTRQETTMLIRTAELFNSQIRDFTERLNNESVREYAQKFRKLTGNK